MVGTKITDSSDVSSLELTEERANSLYLILQNCIHNCNHKIATLKEILKTFPENRMDQFKDDVAIQEALNLSNFLLEDAKELQIEVGKIIIDFNSQNDKPTIIKPPVWGK